MSEKAKGYVVRCEKDSGRPGMPHEYIGDNNTLDEAIADLVRALPHYGKGRIFAVAEDGTETPLPTYEEALAALEKERGLALAAWVNRDESERFLFLLAAELCDAGLLGERAVFPNGDPSPAGVALLAKVYKTHGDPQGPFAVFTGPEAISAALDEAGIPADAGSLVERVQLLAKDADQQTTLTERRARDAEALRSELTAVGAALVALGAGRNDGQSLADALRALGPSVLRCARCGAFLSRGQGIVRASADEPRAALDPHQALCLACDREVGERSGPPISSRPGRLGGAPCISGTRLPVASLRALWRGGHTVSGILRLYPYLKREQVDAALALTLAEDDTVPPPAATTTAPLAHSSEPGDVCPACSDVLGSPSPCAITHDFAPGAYPPPEANAAQQIARATTFAFGPNAERCVFMERSPGSQEWAIRPRQTDRGAAWDGEAWEHCGKKTWPFDAAWAECERIVREGIWPVGEARPWLEERGAAPPPEPDLEPAVGDEPR